jgi:hypothetical protein
MTVSHYSGWLNGVVIGGVPLQMTHPGKVFWVGNSATTLEGELTAEDEASKGTFLEPFATIDYAVGQCAANRGDVILVRPNHTETVTAAAGLALDVAGIAVIGLGKGSDRATVNFTTAVGADMDIDAANITLYNLLFLGGFDALTNPIDVNAADCTISHCEYRDVTGEATDVILGDANADRLTIEHYFHNGAAGAGANSAIALVGSDNPHIHDFWITGNFAVGAIDIRTTACVDVNIHDGYIWTKNAADIAIVDTITASTGKIGPNINIMLTDNAANITTAVTGATFQYFGGATPTAGPGSILVSNLVNESAIPINKVEATDA